MPIDTHNSAIEIPLSKSKLTWLLLIAVAFGVVGLLFIINPSEFEGSDQHHHPRFEILTVGYACVIFFGAGIAISILKLFDKKPGLLIDNHGITINPGSFSTSFIEWTKIERFGIITIRSTKLIAIYLKNPEKFIEQIDNGFKKKVASFSLKSYGTPISITTNTLKVNTDELYTLLIDRLNNKYK